MSEGIIYIVDDDEAVRDGLSLLLQSADMNTRCFASANEFLDGHDPGVIACALLDLRMPGTNGLELQAQMQQRGIDMPVIFLTGHGDVPVAVEALKNGALDFLQKPVADEAVLLGRVTEALRLHEETRARSEERDAVRELIAQLTPREREIMDMVVEGKANKVIAIELGISERTVELHRSRVMKKLKLRSVADLVKLSRI